MKSPMTLRCCEEPNLERQDWPDPRYLSHLDNVHPGTRHMKRKTFGWLHQPLPLSASTDRRENHQVEPNQLTERWEEIIQNFFFFLSKLCPSMGLKLTTTRDQGQTLPTEPARSPQSRSTLVFITVLNSLQVPPYCLHTNWIAATTLLWIYA